VITKNEPRNERRQALRRAQGLLSGKKEGRVTVDELLNAELAAQFIRGKNGSVTLDGRKGIPLRSGTVQTLAMVMRAGFQRGQVRRTQAAERVSDCALALGNQGRRWQAMASFRLEGKRH
jgi:hypothetical protein